MIPTAGDDARGPIRPSLASRIATALLLLCALATGSVACIPFSVVRSQLDRASGDGSADAYTPSIHLKFQAAAATLCIASIALLIVRRRLFPRLERAAAELLQSVLADLRRARKQLRARPSIWLAAGLPTLIAVMVTQPYMHDPIRYDEAHTTIHYAQPPIYMALTQYDAPNNHVLHSVAAHYAIQCFGFEPETLRIPARMAGLLCTLLVGWYAAVRFRPAVGFTAGFLTALLPTCVEQAVSARGYSLCALWFLLSIIAARRLVYRSSASASLLLITSSALALATVPTMIYGIWIWMTWMMILGLSRRSRAPRSVLLRPILHAAAAIVLAVVFYTPILLSHSLGELQSVISSSKLSTSQQVQSFSEYVGKCASWLLWESSTPLSIAVVIGGASLFVIRSRRRRQEGIWLIPAVASVALPLLIQRALPPERIWTFLLPIGTIWVAAGWHAIGSLLIQRLRAAHSADVAARLTPAIAGALMLIPAYRFAFEPSFVPYARQSGWPEAGLVYEELTYRPHEPIIVVTPLSAPLIYQFRKHGQSEEHFLQPGRGLTDDSTALVLVSKEFHQTVDSVLQELKLTELFGEYDRTPVASPALQADVYRLSRRKPETASNDRLQ